MADRPFMPIGPSVDLACTQTTGNVALPAATNVPLPTSLRIINTNAFIAKITFGSSNAITASLTTSMTIALNSGEVITPPPNSTWVAAICNTGESTTLNFTRGFGY